VSDRGAGFDSGCVRRVVIEHEKLDEAVIVNVDEFPGYSLSSSEEAGIQGESSKFFLRFASSSSISGALLSSASGVNWVSMY
jgi:hypothetical protein